MQDLSNSHLFKYKSEIQRIAKPLFDGSIIEGFGFSRAYKDNYSISLSTIPELLAKGYEEGIYTIYAELKLLNERHEQINKIKNNFVYALGKNMAPKAIIKGVNNVFIIVDYYNDYFDMFKFSSITGEEDITNYCYKNFNYLIKFKHYFLSEARKIIRDAAANRIQLKDNNGRLYENVKDKKVIENIVPKHYFLSSFSGRQIVITARELKALQYLSEGRTFKEIGQYMNISPRTAQNYQKILEHKLSVFTRSQLIDLYLRSDLIMLDVK